MAFDKPAIFFFTKEPNCSACTAIAPTWENIKADPEFAVYEFEKHDVVDEMDLAAAYYVDAAPTFVLVGKGSTKRLVNPGANELRQEMRNYINQSPNNTGTNITTNTATNASNNNKLTGIAALGLLFPFALVGAVLYLLFKNNKKIDYYDGRF